MSFKLAHAEEYELGRESSFESHETFESANGDDAESRLLPQPAHRPEPSRPITSRLGTFLPSTWRRRKKGRFTKTNKPHRTRCRTCFRGSVLRKTLHISCAFLIVLFST